MTLSDKYLESITPEQRAEFERIRKIVKQLVPEVEEGFGYGMPAFKLHKQTIFWVGAFKNHMSIFPSGKSLGSLEDKLKPYRKSKGTLQFTLSNPIPDKLVREIVENRLQAIVS